ncbi:MAG: cyanoexosortase B [Symploca sp. SIO3E6]|nr:cyanoexosortase B [Caldora sp. SIO3E6]
MQYRSKIPLALERYLFDGLLIALLVILYTPLLIHWCDGWLNKTISLEHEYFSHGLIGIPFATYLGWKNRQQWHQLPSTTHPSGIALLVLGGLFYLTGQSELVNLSLPLLLVGLCLWFKGIPGLKLQSFPLLLIFLATPTAVPYLISPYILPLQRFIAAIAGFFLTHLGMDVNVSGINLLVGGRVVEVAPHCAGLKMLFTNLYVGLILVYWMGTWKSAQKTTLFFLGTIFISVSANIVRNSFLTFFYGTGRDGAFHWLHDSWGGDIYSAGMLIMLVVLLNTLDRYYPMANRE